MSRFLTVTEAAKLTGKSPSSIRRVIYPIVHDDAHPDRPQIAPTVEEVQALRVKGENFAWRISEDLLHREVPITPLSEQPNATSHPVDNGQSELLAMLREELQIKNQQIMQHSELIARQMELISGLGERLREGNILIGSFQQHLALTNGSGRMKSDNGMVEAATHRTGVSSSKAKRKNAAKLLKKDRGWFRRVFE